MKSGCIVPYPNKQIVIKVARNPARIRQENFRRPKTRPEPYPKPEIK